VNHGIQDVSLRGVSAPSVRFKHPFPLQHVRIDSLLGAMGEWLSKFEWDCWCTWTFDARFGDTGPSPDRCLYHTRRWVEHLPGPTPQYFIAVERGTGGRVHSHGLLRFPDRWAPKRKTLHASWKERYGRNRFLPYDPTRGAAYYIAKYITKEPLHWDVGGHILPV